MFLQIYIHRNNIDIFSPIPYSIVYSLSEACQVDVTFEVGSDVNILQNTCRQVQIDRPAIEHVGQKIITPFQEPQSQDKKKKKIQEQKKNSLVLASSQTGRFGAVKWKLRSPPIQPVSQALTRLLLAIKLANNQLARSLELTSFFWKVNP